MWLIMGVHHRMLEIGEHGYDMEFGKQRLMIR